VLVAAAKIFICLDMKVIDILVWISRFIEANTTQESGQRIIIIICHESGLLASDDSLTQSKSHQIA
jgi:hypothetical protein